MVQPGVLLLDLLRLFKELIDQHGVHLGVAHGVGFPSCRGPVSLENSHRLVEAIRGKRESPILVLKTQSAFHRHAQRSLRLDGRSDSSVTFRDLRTDQTVSTLST